MAVRRLDSDDFAKLIELLYTLGKSIDAVRESIKTPLETLISFEGTEDGAFSGEDAKGLYDSLREISDINNATFGKVQALNKAVTEAADKLEIALSYLSKSTEEVAQDLNKVTTDAKN